MNCAIIRRPRSRLVNFGNSQPRMSALVALTLLTASCGQSSDHPLIDNVANSRKAKIGADDCDEWPCGITADNAANGNSV
jgi:hypothetical protein